MTFCFGICAVPLNSFVAFIVNSVTSKVCDSGTCKSANSQSTAFSTPDSPKVNCSVTANLTVYVPSTKSILLEASAGAVATIVSYT